MDSAFVITKLCCFHLVHVGFGTYFTIIMSKNLTQAIFYKRHFSNFVLCDRGDSACNNLQISTQSIIEKFQ